MMPGGSEGAAEPAIEPSARLLADVHQFASQMTGANGHLDVAALRAFMEPMKLIVQLAPSPGDGRKVELTRVLAEAPDLFEEMALGRWTERHDQFTEDLAVLGENLASDDSPTTRTIVLIGRLSAAKMRVRQFLESLGRSPAGTPSPPPGLDRLIADLESGLPELENVGSAGAFFVGTARETIGLLLWIRLLVEVRTGGAQARPRSWYVDTAAVARRARKYLAAVAPANQEHQKTRAGEALLGTPGVNNVMGALSPAGVDGVVYLIPAAEDDGSAPPRTTGAGLPTRRAGPARALVVQAVGLGLRTEVLALPDVDIGAGSPLTDYLQALGGAVDGFASAPRSSQGFRGTPAGRVWAEALERLGAWTYDRILGPILAHVRGWELGRPPQLVLVPFGELAAVPYAAAWTADPALPGGRRYALHDLVLTQAVSGRLQEMVARRPRLPPSERVVLVADPTGEFPFARAVGRSLRDRWYPAAKVFGRTRAPDGPATAAAVLAALPSRDSPGASLLHLATHGTVEPTARLRTTDGWLSLDQILEQARDRPPDAPGGLVVTSACLTDSTRSHYDESVTLATAFLAAGATGVVGTRWPIDDDTTAVFMVHLHGRLAAGHPPARAVRLAQLDMLDTSHVRPDLHPHLAAVDRTRLANPASWAGFVYHGI